MAEKTVEANGIDIWTEGFGDPADPAILLVMGATAQGILWPDEFCQSLVDGGRYVIRYDNRDTGQSSIFDFESQPYTVNDMADDAVGVLDAYGIDRAHFVGASMGGMISQAVAIRHPDRLLTLTSIMSSPGGGSVAQAISDGTAAADLPGPDPQLIEVMMERVANPPSTRQEHIDVGVKMWRALAGSMEPFDEAGTRAREELVYDRAKDITKAMNHGLAVGASPDRTADLARVTVPTLVIHGTADPILPYAHGEATAKAIPGSQLLPVEGMGHELPEGSWGIVVPAILEHTA